MKETEDSESTEEEVERDQGLAVTVDLDHVRSVEDHRSLLV